MKLKEQDFITLFQNYSINIEPYFESSKSNATALITFYDTENNWMFAVEPKDNWIMISVKILKKFNTKNKKDTEKIRTFIEDMMLKHFKIKKYKHTSI